MLGRQKLDRLVEEAVARVDLDTGETGQIGTVLLVVEVRPLDLEEGTTFYTFCNDRREWIQRAMLKEGIDTIEFVDFNDD